jgi:hypothetical protein
MIFAPCMESNERLCRRFVIGNLKSRGMNDHQYTELLSLQATELDGERLFCPEDQVIAEYFEGNLAEAERTRLERHLVDCRFCLASIGMLERLEQSPGNQRVPGDVLATAKQMTRGSSGRRRGSAPAWAVAAVVIVTLVMLVDRNQESGLEPGALSPAVSSAGNNGRQLRTINRAATEINVLVPSPGADMMVGSMIRWAEVPGNLHYNIYVLSRAGDVIFTQRLATTEWVLQGMPQLVAGNEYYFRVEAPLANGRSVSSKHLVFRVVETL